MAIAQDRSLSPGITATHKREENSRHVENRIRPVRTRLNPDNGRHMVRNRHCITESESCISAAFYSRS